MTEQTAVLVLEDGRTFTGEPYGAVGRTVGEIVFNTGMTGYQETLTDPSYHRQIVVMTAPHVGNTGLNDEDPESARMWVAGFVVRDPAIRPSSWRSARSLDDGLVAEGIVGLSGIDTRALTRHLRERGVMRAGIFSGPSLVDSSGRRRTDQDLLDEVMAAPVMTGADLASEVTVAEPYTVEPVRGPASGTEPVATVVAIDLGIKSMTPQRLAERGVRTHVLPSTATTEQVLALEPDGVFYSNGPGDPASARHEIELLRDVLDRRIPFFGICYGNQLLGRALGYGTYKLTYGHRGVNQPVMDRRTRKVEITAHNHGFAVDAPLEGESVAPYDGGRYGRVTVSHVALNDDVVEGLECLDLPAFSVQYHPEAAAGPHDAAYLFDRFLALMTSAKTTHEETAPDATSH
ncbi:glutamine-hydrolyzing carbamoyl-phosphate synthase small subunit [Actinotalea subterranea]|uniref:glutamine-hydrolyzing carbamoyl-phosphate synthase small subunit n=1 Tax=Actinotalea subterranea TaxID=2607497 RepID=UPI0011F03931|nr:glutamine-hydrolyzing carbamoyl-phosphate synthase small subunit [Actinotalea subterranea]